MHNNTIKEQNNTHELNRLIKKNHFSKDRLLELIVYCEDIEKLGSDGLAPIHCTSASVGKKELLEDFLWICDKLIDNGSYVN